MKKFENPVIDVEKFEAADVITTSCTGYDGSNDAGDF